MDTYLIAGLKVNMECSGRTKKAAEPYKTDFCENADFEIRVTSEMTERYRQKYPDAEIDDWEYFISNVMFASRIMKNDGFLLHSSAVSSDGKAYMFSADSGVGKSTHTAFWCTCFDDTFIINDDKPAIRRLNGKFYVFGTPWSGKSDKNSNVQVPLKAICFIERAQKNSIERMTDNTETIKLLLAQTMRNAGRENMTLLLELLDKLFREVPFYKLKCLPDASAAHIAREAMNNAER